MKELNILLFKTISYYLTLKIDNNTIKIIKNYTKNNICYKSTLILYYEYKKIK